MTDSENFKAAITKAVGAHGVWKLRLKTAIASGASEITPAQVSCDDKCDFGRWLYGREIPAAVRVSANYEAVRRKHAEFHKVAGQVLTAALGGKADEASRILGGPFEVSSRDLTTAMRGWSI